MSGELIERLRGGKCPECQGWGEVAYFGEQVGCRCLGKYEAPISMETRKEAADEITRLRAELSALRGDTVSEPTRRMEKTLGAKFVRTDADRGRILRQILTDTAAQRQSPETKL